MEIEKDVMHIIKTTWLECSTSGILFDLKIPLKLKEKFRSIIIEGTSAPQRK